MHPHLICLIVTLLSMAGLQMYILVLDPNLFLVVNTVLAILSFLVILLCPCKCCLRL